MRVADPGIDQLFVQSDGFFDRLVAGLVVETSVELSSTVCSCHHVHNSLIAAVTKLDSAPVGLIKQSLPYLVCSIGISVHDSTIAEDHCGAVAFQCCLEEYIFQGHLRLHDLNLEAHLVHQRHLVRLNEAAALIHHRCCLRNYQDLEALLSQMVSDRCHCSSFSGAGTSSQADTIDGMLRRRHDLWVVEHYIMLTGRSLRVHS